MMASYLAVCPAPSSRPEAVHRLFYSHIQPYVTPSALSTPAAAHLRNETIFFSLSLCFYNFPISFPCSVPPKAAAALLFC